MSVDMMKPMFEETAPRQRRSKVEMMLGLFLPAVLILLMAFFTWKSPNNAFIQPSNLLTILTQNAYVVVLTIPLAMLVMSGGIDLSIGSVMALSACIGGLAWQNGNVWLGLVLGLGTGLVMGLVNGGLVSGIGLNPIVVTLGTLAIARGIAQLMATNPIYDFPEVVDAFGNGSVLWISNQIWVAIIVVLIGMAALNRFPFGRHLVAIGVNERAAFLAGLPVKRIKFSLYLVVGLASAVAGLMLASRINSAPGGTMGVGIELVALTAVLLGGVPFTGGYGAIWRVLVGVLIVAVLQNGTVMMNVPSDASKILFGGVLLIAALLELIRQRMFKQ